MQDPSLGGYRLPCFSSIISSCVQSLRSRAGRPHRRWKLNRQGCFPVTSAEGFSVPFPLCP